MPAHSPRWRIAVLAALLLALLALVHARLLWPAPAIVMTAQPCAAPAASRPDAVPGDWAAFCAYAADNARLAGHGVRPDLVLFGDSILADWREFQPGLFGESWINRGVRGQGTIRLLARFRPDVIALRPRAVLIEGGINDIIAADALMNPDAVASQIESMADLALAHGIVPILSTVPPVDRFTIRPQVRPHIWVGAINQRIRALAARRGLVLADLHGALVAPDGRGQRPGFSDDGIHPTAAAYRELEPVVRAALAAALRQVPPAP